MWLTAMVRPALLNVEFESPCHGGRRRRRSCDDGRTLYLHDFSVACVLLFSEALQQSLDGFQPILIVGRHAVMASAI